MLGFPQLIQPRKTLDVEEVAKIQQELSDAEGFNSYQEVKLWLSVCQNIEISYPTIHRIVRYELRGKLKQDLRMARKPRHASLLKVPRPIHAKQKPGIIEAFKNCFPARIKGLIDEIREKYGANRSISYWFQDETRLGYRTESGQKITRAGVKPKQILQWHYSYYYIYGAECARRQAPEFNSGEPAGLVAPVKGNNFFYEFSHFNSDCLGLFLEKFSQKYQDEIHIIQLDKGLARMYAPCHTAKKLIIPENIVLLFQPPYCPELNPIERVWQYIKQQLKNVFFTSLDDVRSLKLIINDDYLSPISI